MNEPKLKDKKKIINHGEQMQMTEFSMDMCPDPENDPLDGSPYTHWSGSKRRRHR